MENLSKEAGETRIKSPQLYQLSYGPFSAICAPQLNARPANRSENRSGASSPARNLDRPPGARNAPPEGRAPLPGCARPKDCRAHDDRPCPMRGLSRVGCPCFRGIS